MSFVSSLELPKDCRKGCLDSFGPICRHGGLCAGAGVSRDWDQCALLILDDPTHVMHACFATSAFTVLLKSEAARVAGTAVMLGVPCSS